MERIAKLKVVDIVQETTDAISIHFKQPFLKKIKYTPGQFLTLLVQIDDKIERRCYSLNTAPKVDSTLSVTVKRIKDGKVSNHLFENVKVGQSMKMLYPMGSFTITPDPKAKRHIILFGAGSGITPLMSILKTILNVESESKVSLVYGNRDEESIIFNETLNEYKSRFEDRLTLLHILENPGDFQSCYKGRVERTQVPVILSDLPRYSSTDTQYYICGPSRMMVEAEEGLKMAGVSDSAIHIEKFSAPPPTAQESKADGALLENREVTIVNRGASYEVPVKAGRYILDSALDQKIDLPYVCMDGICGSCKADCVTGEVFMRKGHALSDKEVADNKVLPCICKPISNNVVIEYA